MTNESKPKRLSPAEIGAAWSGRRLKPKENELLEMANSIIKTITEILDEVEETGNDLTLKQVNDLMFLFEPLGEDGLEFIKTREIRTYWKLLDVVKQLREYEMKLKIKALKEEFPEDSEGEEK